MKSCLFGVCDGLCTHVALGRERNISGGHVEYEQNRWLEAFGLSLIVASMRDALAESPATTYTPRRMFGDILTAATAAAVAIAAATSGVDTNMEGFSAPLASWLSLSRSYGQFCGHVAP